MKQKYLDKVKEFEGFHARPYWDYRQWTNGYGTRAKHKKEKISRATAEWRLNKEISESEALVTKFANKHGVTLPEGVHAALSSLTYNAGARWMNAGLGSKIKKGQFESAKSNFKAYHKAGGKALRGLIKRRNAEVEWFDDHPPVSIPKIIPDEGKILLPPLTPAEGAPYNDMPWLNPALAYMGQREIPGARDNPTVVALWYLGKAGTINEDETPWCAAFVSACLELAGVKSARTGWSRSYLNWGVKQDTPQVGTIVVFSRGKGGHIGFVVGKYGDQLAVLGGNQSNQVNVRLFPKSRVLGYRWPEGWDPPEDKTLPTVKAGLSITER